MQFLPLDELLKERDRLRGWVKSNERDGDSLVCEGGFSADDVAFLNQCTREMLADVEREIAERTGAVSSDDGII